MFRGRNRILKGLKSGHTDTDCLSGYQKLCGCVVWCGWELGIDIHWYWTNKLKRMTRDKTDCLIQVDVALFILKQLFGSISSSKNVKFENI